jgi:hypothetical protein
MRARVAISPLYVKASANGIEHGPEKLQTFRIRSCVGKDLTRNRDPNRRDFLPGAYSPMLSKNSFTLAKKPADSGLVFGLEASSKDFSKSRCLRVRFFGVSTSTWI